MNIQRNYIRKENCIMIDNSRFIVKLLLLCLKDSNFSREDGILYWLLLLAISHFITIINLQNFI